MNVLHVEDNPNDAELVHDLLVTEWPHCRLQLVSRREDLIAQLSQHSPDLILCDFTLVSFNGREALTIAQEKAPETPFIFLSGTIGEDRAIEALQSGASDYILKDRPKRLLTAIKRVIRDVQERRQRRVAEEQFLRVQRLENIGMLAAGIAHDFNNVLAPILMAAPLLRDRTSDPSDISILNSVEQSAQRGADLVRQILGFSHGISGAPHEIQLKHLLRDLIAVMRQTFPKSIQLEEFTPSSLWPVRANPTHVHQILLNLCVNARDAMPNGGTLRIRAENQMMDAAMAATTKHARPGVFVRLDVEDSGTGIPPEIIERIWEPFYTTKDAGKGTGLGLSTVRGIVEAHHGFITVETKPGNGTAFRVYLPAVPGASADAAAKQDPEKTKRGNGELVLVVDDDPNVRAVAEAMLTRHGYRVLTAQDGTEALTLFAPRALEIRVVITDIHMPNLDGIALIKILRGLSASVRILAITGVADEHDRSHATRLAGAILLKPFTGPALLNTVEHLLEAEPPTLGGTAESRSQLAATSGESV